MNPVERLCRIFSERRWSFSVAESCTGGVLSAKLTAWPGISTVFKGGIVSYSNEAKRDLLGIPASLLQVLGAVSEPVALRMASGARGQFKSTWAVGVTGIAGPSGGSGEKPVGTVCWAVVGPAFEYAGTERFKGDRAEIQGAASEFILEKLLTIIS